jgi:isoleucyl-tRNA synthetase
MTHDEQNKKSERALQEEATLAFWNEKKIFEKTVAKDAPKGEYVFYEGPPTANAKPALHHLEARAFKDVIPRYKTMQGYHVPRRAGWDTHGLPVELQIEKKLGLTSKKQIEEYGVAKFNKECKDSVFTYIKDWETFTDRIGYWVDKKSAYYTFDTSYIESLWSIVGKINDRGLLYKDYKIVPWCPRCGTGLSSHELAQGYMDVKDLSVTAKCKVVGQENTYILAWTTTPWTLPGNVALAVGKDIDYVTIRVGEENFIIAKERLSLIGGEYEIVLEIKGSDLVGLEYEPLYPYLKTEAEKKGLDMSKAFHVYAADFVTTTDGTGVVHIAPMYGADDFALATSQVLPKFHTVDETGHFIEGTDFLEKRFAKDEEVAVDIIKDLAHRGLLFKKEKYEHSYPHCWRCKTPLLYYARDSWYVRMSELRDKLLEANNTINWEPNHIKEGRFGEWIREVKDWAFSRERYWGTPLPVWSTDDGERVVVDSVETLKSLMKTSGNNYFFMRHGQTANNLLGVWSCDSHVVDPLTEEGKRQVEATAQTLKDKNIDIIISSPFPRTQQSAHEVARVLGIDEKEIIADKRLGEWNIGAEYDKRPFADFFAIRNASGVDRYHFKTEDGESYAEVFKRVGDFLYDIEKEYQGKNILIVSHGAPCRSLVNISEGISFKDLYEQTRDFNDFNNAEVREILFIPMPHDEEYNLDLHKPYVDQVELVKDGKRLTRAKEVLDVWFDSGSMPFAQEHFPFDGKLAYPADFISEAIDQTRGWFYTLLAVGVLMEKGAPYKNVICLGHLLDKDGKKMSKSIGNIVEPFEQMDKFGVDAVRWWMYSVNAPGESKNYDEKSVAEINNRVFNLFSNVLSFYELYREKELENINTTSENILDKWILAILNQTISESTNGLDSYDLFKPTRAIREFIDNLSTWYLRRSRDRIKDGDTDAKQTLYTVLKTTAQLMAPFAPFFAEYVWQKLKSNSDEESVHLSEWPTFLEVDHEILRKMEKVRYFCTLGNAERKKVNIPVRQPLQSIVVQYKFTDEQLVGLIKEELNVKEVIWDIPRTEEIVLNTEITPELKLEGDYRELVRMIQDLRKEKGLSAQDSISLILPSGYEAIVDSFAEELKKTVGAKEVFIEGKDIVIK